MRRWRAVGVITGVTVLSTACAPGAGRSLLDPDRAEAAARGRAVITELNCVACHVIPGVDGAGTTGPPLVGYRLRPYIAGNLQLPNTQENLVRWLMDPPAFEPNTDMPDLDLSRAQAQDIATYLRALYEEPPELPVEER